MDELTQDLPLAELAVLAAALETDGACLDDLTLIGEDFLDPRNGEIYDAMVRGHLNGHHVTLATAMDQMPQHTVLLGQVSEYGRLRFAVAEHAAIVARAALRRRLLAAADGIRYRTENHELDERELAEQVRGLVDGAVGEPRSRVRFLRDLVPGVIDRLSEDAQSGALFTPSPWPSLDALIGGFRPGCVYVFGARPSVGKTVVAQQCATALAMHGLVSFSSLEMSEQELVTRFMAERAVINVTRLKDGTLSLPDWERLARNRRRIDELPISIDDRPAVTAAEIRAQARTVSRHGKLAGVIVDYMQLVVPMNPRAEPRNQIAESSRLFKVMAKDLGVPVIVLSQLNRESENRADHRPRLSEFKESGAIEQDADVAILMSREEKLAGHCLIMDVAKSRHGETGVVELRWEGALSRAVEWDEEQPEIGAV